MLQTHHQTSTVFMQVGNGCIGSAVGGCGDNSGVKIHVDFYYSHALISDVRCTPLDQLINHHTVSPPPSSTCTTRLYQHAILIIRMSERASSHLWSPLTPLTPTLSSLITHHPTYPLHSQPHLSRPLCLILLEEMAIAIGRVNVYNIYTSCDPYGHGDSSSRAK